MEWETKFQGSWKYLVTKKITEQNEKAQNRINFEKKKNRLGRLAQFIGVTLGKYNW